MNAMVDKAHAFIGKKKQVDPEMVRIMEKKAQLEDQLRTKAGHIVRLQAKAEAQVALDADQYDPAQMHVVHTELDAAKRVFFTLFNALRELYNLEPLVGVMFTGDYNYESHVKG